MQNQRILITGGTGFIGKSLIKSLEGNEIHIITRQNLVPVSTQMYHIGNIADVDVFRRLSKIDFTYVFHLAWDGLPDRSSKYSELNRKRNKQFLINLKHISFERLIAVGSCLELEQPDSAFARAKNSVLEDIQDMHLNFIWPRVFYSYGYGQHPNSLLNSILDKTDKGKEFTLVNPGVAHDFVNIADVVEGLKQAAESEFIGSVDIGTGRAITVGSFTKEVFKILGLDFNLDEYETNDSLVANIIETKNCINWQSKVDLESGLRSALRQKGRVT